MSHKRITEEDRKLVKDIINHVFHLYSQRYGPIHYPLNFSNFFKLFGINRIKHCDNINSAGQILFDKGKEIILSRDDTYERKRFTIAHEIGHLCIESNFLNSPPYFKARGYYQDNRIEKMCDLFAVELLIPSDMLERKFQNFPEEATFKFVEDLGSTFNVSLSAIIKRIDYLDILNGMDIFFFIARHCSNPFTKRSKITKLRIVSKAHPKDCFYLPLYCGLDTLGVKSTSLLETLNHFEETDDLNEVIRVPAVNPSTGKYEKAFLRCHGRFKRYGKRKLVNFLGIFKAKEKFFPEKSADGDIGSKTT